MMGMRKKILSKAGLLKYLDNKKDIYIYIYFFFLISKNDIYTKGYSMHEEHRVNLENTSRRKHNKNKKENQTNCIL